MGRLEELRNMTPAEVARIHRVAALVGQDDGQAVELLADLRAYAGRAWPVMLREALRRYNRARRGDESVGQGVE